MTEADSSLLSKIAADVSWIREQLGIFLSSDPTSTDLTRSDLSSTDLTATTKDPDPKTLAGQAWLAYAGAYKHRYGVEPVRNGRVNANMRQLVARIGMDAPPVAAFFVRSEDPFYVKRCHHVGNLLADAEKLRMEWATNRKPAPTLTFQQRSDAEVKQRAEEAAARRRAATRALLDRQQSTEGRTQPDSAKEKLAKLMEGIGR